MHITKDPINWTVRDRQWTQGNDNRWDSVYN